jgi:hypothetical protein
MEKDEFIIINKTTLQKRIEELENKRDSEHKKGHDKSALRYENTILELKQILSQSLPLEVLRNSIDSKIKDNIQEHCSDHTPYRGVCGTCGNYDNWDEIKDIDGLKESITEIFNQITKDL